jgi:hypothetical protein
VFYDVILPGDIQLGIAVPSITVPGGARTLKDEILYEPMVSLLDQFVHGLQHGVHLVHMQAVWRKRPMLTTPGSDVAHLVRYDMEEDESRAAQGLLRCQRGVFPACKRDC